jgi:hypothetical protein
MTDNWYFLDREAIFITAQAPGDPSVSSSSCSRTCRSITYTNWDQRHAETIRCMFIDFREIIGRRVAEQQMLNKQYGEMRRTVLTCR